MGIIKRADLESYTRDAVPMDLNDLHKRGQAVIEHAQSKAAQLLKDAHEERDRLLAAASKEGHQQGFTQGLEEGTAQGLAQGTAQAQQTHQEQLAQIESAWIQALQVWESNRTELQTQAKTEVIALAAEIASRVIKRTIDLDPEVVVDQLESVLETLVTPTDIRVRVHPSDVELLSRVMPSMIDQCASCNHADLVPDESLAPGSCVVNTKGGGTVDASIAKQLDRIVATMLPAHRGPDYDAHLDATSDSSNDIDDSTSDTSQDDAA